jgi:succinoglycan biosynthesis protein ExoO
MPRVSIIIAVLNGIRTIGKAIESAQAQTERDLEILVVDDGSTDGTPDFVHGYAARDPRIRLIRLEKNVGAAAATNVAIAQAKGDWIGVLDADDWYEPGRVEALLKAAAHHDADLVGDNLRIFDHIRGKIIEVTQHCPGGRDLMLDAET